MKDFSGNDFHPTEMPKLINLLNESGIPYEVRLCNDTIQVCYPNVNKMVCDAVCHAFSYGHENGLLEILGLTNSEDEAEGYLDAEEVCRRMANHYYQHYDCLIDN